jgi:hemin uptake protein HemP
MPPSDALPLPGPTAFDNPLTQKRIPSEQLFGAQREVVILHNGREYRLRLTQSGKLILTA